MARLRQYQLSDPNEFVLKLVQAGVSGGAARMELTTGMSRVGFRIDGYTPVARDLDRLLSYLLGKEGSASLRHLATAVNAAVGLRARELRLRSWDGQLGNERIWSPGGNRSSTWVPTAGEGPHLAFEFERFASDKLSELYAKVASRDLWSMFRGKRQAMDPLQGMLHDRCPCCPVPLWINGQPAPGYQMGGAGKAGDLCHYYRAGPGLAPPGVRHGCYEVGRDDHRTFERILALPRDFQRSAQLVIVQDGVLLVVLPLDWEGPGVQVYTSEPFETDLTGLQILRNEHNLKLCRELTLEVARIAEAVAESPATSLSENQRRELLRRARLGAQRPPRWPGP